MLLNFQQNQNRDDWAVKQHVLHERSVSVVTVTGLPMWTLAENW